MSDVDSGRRSSVDELGGGGVGVKAPRLIGRDLKELAGAAALMFVVTTRKRTQKEQRNELI